LTNRINIVFDWLVPETDIVSVAALENAATRTPWRRVYNSGYAIAPKDLPVLRGLWAAASASSASSTEGEVPGTYTEVRGTHSMVQSLCGLRLVGRGPL
jgi:5-methylcytosine-specific restriction protein A